MTKIHLGCGKEILAGFINVDSAKLPGVNVVHDLSSMPWPFPKGEADEILLKHVLEHLPQTVKVMEEIWRISAAGARVVIHVPYWNSSDFITDPTHIRPFNEHTFDFFDPNHWRCQDRPYYSHARFKIKKKIYFFTIIGRYYSASSWLSRVILERLARYFCNVIQVIQFELEAVK